MLKREENGINSFIERRNRICLWGKRWELLNFFFQRGDFMINFGQLNFSFLFIPTRSLTCSLSNRPSQQTREPKKPLINNKKLSFAPHSLSISHFQSHYNFISSGFVLIFGHSIAFIICQYKFIPTVAEHKTANKRK
jgi:hypothetical protein